MANSRALASTYAAAPPLNPTIAESCDLGDWENLKKTFAQVFELYEQDDEATECLPLLHGVIKECHRFLTFYEDPSVLFTSSLPFASPSGSTTHSPDALTPPTDASPRLDASTPAQAERKDSRPKNVDLPTAFHSLLGTALFLLGNLIAQDPSFAQPGEPDDPQTYWLAALEVFQTGDSVPSRTDPNSFPIKEDWRMAIMWGRTLVCLADAAIARKDPKSSGNRSRAEPEEAPELFSLEEPDWPQDSLFAVIARKRPLVTRRMSLAGMTIGGLMALSMDQFSRGIFHMPHPYRARSLLGGAASSTAPSSEPSFSRAKVLFTIASEVLNVAERMEKPTERKRCASWADSVFSQMKMEADMDAWRGAITRAKARCWLIVGSAGVEEIEDALEAGSTDVLLTEAAQEAREGLMTAIDYFEQAKNSASSTPGPEIAELQPLFVESLITLANLTIDEAKREELYARAQMESGGQIDLGDSERMDES